MPDQVNTPAVPTPPVVDGKILSPAEKAFMDEKKAFAPIAVTRNGVSLSFTLQRQAKGPTPDEQYLFPDEKISTESLMKLIGDDVVNRVLHIKFKKGMKDVLEANKASHDGKLDAASFAVEAANYPFVSVSKAALEKQQLDLVNQLLAVDQATPEGSVKASEILMRIRQTKTAIDAKARSTSTADEDTDETDDAPANTPAA